MNETRGERARRGLQKRFAGWAWIALSACVACADPEPLRPAGLLPSERKPLVVQPTPPPAPPTPPPMPKIPGPDPFKPTPIEPPPPAPVEAPAEEPADEKKKERNLGDELRDAMGRPAACLDLGKVVEGGGKLRISVSAYVAPSGRITRATISAPGQTPEAVRCVEQLALGVRMQEPIENAPVRVDTDIEIEAVRGAN